MLIIPHREIVGSVDEIESIVYRNRLLSIYEVEENGRKYYDFMIINIACEVGGKNSAGLVRKIGDVVKTYYMYRGKFASSPFLNREKLVLNPDAIMSVVNTSYSYASKSDKTQRYTMHTNHMDYRTNFAPRYPDGEKIMMPSPKFFTETHQMLCGVDRYDYAENLCAVLEQNDMYRVADFQDDKTQVRFSSVNYDDWEDDTHMRDFGGVVRTISGLKYEDTIEIQKFVALVQHAIYIAQLDAVTMIVDPIDGYQFTNIRSLLHNVSRKEVWKLDGMTFFLSTVEEEFENLRDVLTPGLRIFIDFSPVCCHVKIIPKIPQLDIQNTIRNRSKGDILVYDTDDHL